MSEKKYGDKIPEDGRLLNEAIKYAVDQHAGQVRKGTDVPYITHPLEVLTILNAMQANPTTMMAGVLHDTVEDTGATIDDLRNRFGDAVAALVAGHSEDKSKTWDERKALAIAELAEAPYELKCVVLADKRSNIRNMARDYAELGDALWERFNAPREKQAWYYAGAIDALKEMQTHKETRAAYEEFCALVREVFRE